MSDLRAMKLVFVLPSAIGCPGAGEAVWRTPRHLRSVKEVRVSEIASRPC